MWQLSGLLPQFFPFTVGVGVLGYADLLVWRRRIGDLPAIAGSSANRYTGHILVIGPTTWPSWPQSSKNHPIIQFSLALAKFGTASAFCNDCVQVSQGTGPLANPGGNSVYLCLERFLSTQMYANATLTNSIGVSGNETKAWFRFKILP